jgi:predicted dehydrogenase
LSPSRDAIRIAPRLPPL